MFFSESQDLKTRPLQPGVTVGNTKTFPHGNDNALHPHGTPPEMVEKLSPIFPAQNLCRSVHIANISDNILDSKSSTYTQVPDAELTLEDTSSLDEATAPVHKQRLSTMHPRRFCPLHFV